MATPRPAAVIVLAAGEGTRMKSATPKVLHMIGGRTLLGHAMAAARGGHRMPKEGAPPDHVQDFGGGRLHPGALSSGEDDDGGRAGCSHADELLMVGVEACSHTWAFPLAR